MTRSEKSVLFGFLNTADGWISGYRPDCAEPDFVDDCEDPGITGKNFSFPCIEELNAAVRDCAACALCGTRANAVPGEGPADLTLVRVMVIGEGPGADEDATGRPFVGKAGQLLDRMLASISLSRQTNCYIANIVKCRPPQNREPLPAESAACMPFLRAQIELIRPQLILALGRTAAQNLLGSAEGINRLRGRFYDFCGIPLLPTFHPSALLRDETLKRPAWEDLKALKSELDHISSDDSGPGA
jgi:uracil-DNA glycosylase